jgi:dTDP-4-dehydrorhamnose reductase
VKTLITGCNGQLGRDFCRLLPEAIGMGKLELPIDQRDDVFRTLKEIRPSLVLNCAAYNGVDAAEGDPEPGLAANAQGAENLALACAEINARLVHFSTNYVFDGLAALPYDEAATPNPQSAYARSKWKGEQLVAAANPEALVIRSSGLFGKLGSAVKGGSFPDRILARARRGEAVRVVADQRLNPTSTGDLAAGSLGLAGQGMSGVVHLVAAGCCSWWEFAVETLRLSGVEVEVTPVGSDEFPVAAPRPRNGCLASTRTEPLRCWQEGLAAWVGNG